jgi:hypothetical protein|tara:strand:+ start:104 stop:220 length:117 start_codon:yes stop_codon:yes gene_type:complete
MGWLGRGMAPNIGCPTGTGIGIATGYGIGICEGITGFG